MGEPIRVLIVDDHPVVRRGLVAFLGSREGIEVVAQAADGEEAVAAVAEHAPDVVVMDLVMPGTDGVEATSRIRRDHPDTRVLVLTSYGADDQVVAAIRAGAAGYVLKDADPDEVEAAIRSVQRGQVTLAAPAAAALMADVRRRDAGGPAAAHDGSPAARIGQLTPREREVLSLLGEGLTNRQIARRLGISEKTVKAHVGGVLRTLGVADRTQAALVAARAGLGAADGS